MAQEAPGVFTRARFVEVADDHLGGHKGARGVGPEVGAVCLSISQVRRGLSMAAAVSSACSTVLQQFVLHRIHRRLQLHAAGNRLVLLLHSDVQLVDPTGPPLPSNQLSSCSALKQCGTQK